MQIIFSNTQKQVLKFGILLLSLTPTIMICCDLYKNYKSGSAAGIVLDGFSMVVALYVFGITGSILYSGNLATGVVDFLLYPKKYLKVPPVITSRQKGLIARRQFETAENELLIMRAQHPESPDVALLLAELHAGHYRDCQTAIDDILFYHRKRRWRYHHLNLTLTMRCADFYTAINETGAAIQLLQKETQAKFVYTARERQVLIDRLHSLS